MSVEEPVEDGPAGEVDDGEAGSPIPPLADALLGPLLDSAGDALRRLPPVDVPPAARRLRSFDRRGLATPAAKRQLRRLLEEDEELLGAGAEVLLARPEAARLVAAWEEATAAGGGAPLALVDEASREGKLPLLASVLTAALPAGFEFGLGLVVAMASTAEREAAAAQAVRAATTGQASAEEARRRSDAARSAADAEKARLEAALREERQARRLLEQQASDVAAGSDAHRADLEAAVSEARQRAATAEQRTAEAEKRVVAAQQRTAEADKRVVAAQQSAAEADRRAVSAEQRAGQAERRAVSAEHAAAQAERALSVEQGAGGRGPDRPPARDLDDGALDQVARAAEDLAGALRRLASGSPSGRGPAADRAAGPGEALAALPRHPPPPRPTPPAPPPPLAPRAGGERAAPARPRPATKARRRPVQIPPGMLRDDPAAVAAMVRTPGVAVIVDGYNVSMLAWPEASAAEQRDRLCDALVEFQLRLRCEVTVVFDGAEVSGVRPLRRRGLRIVFSQPGQEADVVVIDEVIFRADEVPVVVVSSDREVRAAAEAEGATSLTADAFLQLMRR